MSKKQRLYVSVENLAKAGVLPAWLADEDFGLHSVQILRHLHGDDLMKSLQFVEGNPYSTDKAYCFIVALMGALDYQKQDPNFYDKVYSVLTGDLEKNYSDARDLCYELSDFARENYNEYVCQWVIEKHIGTFADQRRMNITFLNIYKSATKLCLVAEHLLREYFE